MHIPSYDDLTPPIPDADIREVFAGVARLAPEAGTPPVVGGRSHVAPAFALRASACAPDVAAADRAAGRRGTSHVSGAGALFACLRSVRAPQAMFGVARDFSPRIERHGGDVVLDVSGLGSLLGDAQAIGVELERAAKGCTSDARVAVAPTQTAARLLALTSPRLTVVTADVAGALADLPLASFEQLMTETRVPEVVETCRRWGIRTLGEFAALPRADLSERLGQPGLALQRLASGLDPAPLVPDPCVPRYIESMELEWPIDALEPLSFVLARLLDPLAFALERTDRAAAAIRLDLRLVDRTMHTRRLQLPAAMRDARVLRTLLLLDLESHPPPAALDIVAIEIDPAPSRIVQFSLLERATPSAETMATLMARLRALVGETRCGFARVSDTHRPDGFEMQPWEEDARGKTARGRKPGGLTPRTADAVRAAPVLRRFRPPVAIRVTLDRGRPAHVAIDRRGMPGGEVAQRAGPWRSSGAWWEGKQYWDRDEWDVSFAEGTVARIYQDRVSEVWFLEGVID
jgi:protein ImuB